jgi:hypothetical protein
LGGHEEKAMLDAKDRRCKLCGNQMYVTRFVSETTDRGCVYECLWCDETEKVIEQKPHSQENEIAA